ncbi:MAG: CDP-alcohol phosphatidyltransferase family protein [Planctomycetes bacterium]|nr:CDP-alcohol phosphatidyltransferase family protein [Planctomycetota bacterium]
MGVGRIIGGGLRAARDAQARTLIALGIRPNTLTLAGFGFTVAAGVFLALGAGDSFTGCGPWGRLLSRHNPGYIGLSAWNLWAGACLYLAGATDVLDGAVARIGRWHSTFGAFLDSTIDRFSDFAIFTGIAFYYLWRGNATYSLLAILSICNGFAISYTRARAEDLIERCSVGYWQRGERGAAIFISVLAFNVPAMLWQQAISPAFTVWRRIHYTWQVTAGRTPPEHPRDGSWWDRIQAWRWPRMSWPYDIVTGLNIVFLIFAPIPQTDLIRQLLEG